MRLNGHGWTRLVELRPRTVCISNIPSHRYRYTATRVSKHSGLPQLTVSLYRPRPTIPWESSEVFLNLHSTVTPIPPLVITLLDETPANISPIPAIRGKEVSQPLPDLPMRLLSRAAFVL